MELDACPDARSLVKNYLRHHVATGPAGITETELRRYLAEFGYTADQSQIAVGDLARRGEITVGEKGWNIRLGKPLQRIPYETLQREFLDNRIDFLEE